MQNEITLKLKFKNYEFRRAKAIGKMIEKHRNHDGTIEISLLSTYIINKKIKDGTNVGRAYIPKDYIGYDFLIIETPPITYV